MVVDHYIEGLDSLRQELPKLMCQTADENFFNNGSHQSQIQECTKSNAKVSNLSIEHLIIDISLKYNINPISAYII
jgi:hypothetical protein